MSVDNKYEYRHSRTGVLAPNDSICMFHKVKKRLTYLTESMQRLGRTRLCQRIKRYCLTHYFRTSTSLYGWHDRKIAEASELPNTEDCSVQI